MTHSWAIIVVIVVGAALMQMGMFQTQASARFVGLQAASIQPVPDHVFIQSDGMLVLTVINIKPYTIHLGWVDISPIPDREDVIRTNLDADIPSGDMQSFEINASHIYPGSGASIIHFSGSVHAEENVEFNICLQESFTAGGSYISHEICGEAKNVPLREDDEPECLVNTDCGLCEFCNTNKNCMNSCIGSEVCIFGGAQIGYICQVEELPPPLS